MSRGTWHHRRLWGRLSIWRRLFTVAVGKTTRRRMSSAPLIARRGRAVERHPALAILEGFGHKDHATLRRDVEAIKEDRPGAVRQRIGSSSHHQVAAVMAADQQRRISE